MPNLGTSTITAAALATKMAARLAAMAARGSVFGAMGSWKTSTSADLKTQPATARYHDACTPPSDSVPRQRERRHDSDPRLVSRQATRQRGGIALCHCPQTS